MRSGEAWPAVGHEQPVAGEKNLRRERALAVHARDVPLDDLTARGAPNRQQQAPPERGLTRIVADHCLRQREAARPGPTYPGGRRPAVRCRVSPPQRGATAQQARRESHRVPPGGSRRLLAARQAELCGARQPRPGADPSQRAQLGGGGRRRCAGSVQERLRLPQAGRRRR